MAFAHTILPLLFADRGLAATLRRGAGVSLLAVTAVACGASGPSDAGTGGSCSIDVKPAPGVVVTDRGAVKGAASGTTWVYRGIPYAAPPVGALRFRPTEPHACWPGVLDATAYGPKCLQLDDAGNPVGSEDCLTLDVWSPAGASPKTPLPVLFFVHGGGNIQGAASQQRSDGTYVYDGQALAESRRAVVVTLDYRLQAAGFLSIPELDAESPHGSSGDYGLLDQLFALGWVQRNIRAFGGDPEHVLLFGQSAGAFDTCALISSPLAAGLFSAALMESGGCTAQTKSEAQAFGATVVAGAHCTGASDVLACLRALSSDALVTAAPTDFGVEVGGGGYQPNVDGWVLSDVPLATVSAGKHNHVPFIVGANEDETGGSVGKMTESDYENAVLSLAGGAQSVTNEILAEYPSAQYASPRAAYVALTSDREFICPARTVARAAVKGQSQPVYRYFFTHVADNAPAAIKALGAVHGAELFYVFDHLDVLNYMPSAGDTALAAAIGGYWSRLGAVGDPNGQGAVTWPRYDATKDSFLQLDDTIVAGDGVRTQQCDFWDGLGSLGAP